MGESAADRVLQVVVDQQVEIAALLAAGVQRGQPERLAAVPPAGMAADHTRSAASLRSLLRWFFLRAGYKMILLRRERGKVIGCQCFFLQQQRRTFIQYGSPL